MEMTKTKQSRNKNEEIPPSLPRVSVLMSVYNGENYIKTCLESVLGQSFSDLEFIVVDDGSVDDSRRILESLNDPRLKLLFNNKNIGITRSLNKGLQIARGGYVARIDCDDVCMPERLERQVQFLDAHPSCVAVGSAIEMIDRVSRVTGRALKPLGNQELKFMMLFYSPFFHPSVMFHRCVAGNRVFYNENFETAQDYELWVRLAAFGEFRNIPECLVQVRSRPDSVTALRRDRQIATHKAISRRMIDACGSTDTSDETFSAMYETILTEHPLSFSRGRMATRAIWGLAQSWESLGARPYERPKAVVAEFLFNHLLRKRRHGNGVLAFCGAFAETRGGVAFHLACRLRSMIQRFLACRRYGGLSGAP